MDCKMKLQNDWWKTKEKMLEKIATNLEKDYICAEIILGETINDSFRIFLQ